MTADSATLMRLELLRHQIATARSCEQLQLQERGARPGPVLAARLVTLDALVDYADALTALSWPVPRTVLAEIRLYEGLTQHCFPS